MFDVLLAEEIDFPKERNRKRAKKKEMDEALRW